MTDYSCESLYSTAGETALSLLGQRTLLNLPLTLWEESSSEGLELQYSLHFVTPPAEAPVADICAVDITSTPTTTITIIHELELPQILLSRFSWITH